MNELPNGWVRAPLKLLLSSDGIFSDGDWIESKDQDPGGSIRLLQLADIGDGYFVDKSSRFVNEEKFAALNCTKLKSGDVLIARMPDPLGRACLLPEMTQPCITVVDVAVFRTGEKGISNKWLVNAINSPQLRAFMEINSSGTTRKRISRGKLTDMELPVPPLNEQKRIADKLDAVLTRVDVCRNHLNRIPAILKRFRQSVLAAATSGKLTEDWRKEQQTCAKAQDLIGEIQHAQQAANIRVRGGAIFPSLSDLPDVVDLPDAWVVAGFDAMAAPISNALKAGPFGSALKKNMYVARGYKIYGQEQVIAGDENLGDYFIDEQKYAELNSCAVTSGDILISLVGTIGRVLILSDRCADGIINPRLVKLSLYPSLNREFVSLYLQSPLAQNFFKAKSHGGTMDILNLGILRELPILLPPITEQTEIVRRVEALFAYADRLEARHTAARAQVEKLTPATLAKAFRGELVPQDPNDEPASVLLERIRATTQVKDKQTKIPRRAPMTKHNAETVKAIILKMPMNRFSFDELRNQVSTDYESLKDIVFVLLSESKPPLRQVFDDKTQAICLERI